MTEEESNFFVPPLLYLLGYARLQSIKELGRRGTVPGSFLGIRQAWGSWRGIFEYLACAEYARHLLHNLAQSKQTGGLTGLAGRYDAASLVFFGQATLDNVAAWLCR